MNSITNKPSIQLQQNFNNILQLDFVRAYEIALIEYTPKIISLMFGNT